MHGGTSFCIRTPRYEHSPCCLCLLWLNFSSIAKCWLCLHCGYFLFIFPKFTEKFYWVLLPDLSCLGSFSPCSLRHGMGKHPKTHAPPLASFFSFCDIVLIGVLAYKPLLYSRLVLCSCLVTLTYGNICKRKDRSSLWTLPLLFFLRHIRIWLQSGERKWRTVLKTHSVWEIPNDIDIDGGMGGVEMGLGRENFGFSRGHNLCNCMRQPHAKLIVARKSICDVEMISDYSSAVL